MRVKAIEIENFKGISERVRVDLKPITLLFGANSAGKSTILQALLYMKGVLERRNLDAISTPVLGRALDLGGFQNFVYGHDLSRRVRILLDIEVEREGLPEMAPAYEFRDRDCGWWPKAADIFMREKSKIEQFIHSAQVEIEIQWDEASCAPVTAAYAVGLNGWKFAQFERKQGKCWVTCTPYMIGSPRSEGEAGSARAMREDRLVLEDEVGEDEVGLEREGIGAKELITLQKVIPRFAGKKPSVSGLKNWRREYPDPLFDFSWKDTLELAQADMEFDEDQEVGADEENEVARMLAWNGTAFLASLIIGPGMLALEWLQGLRHLGPLRARPPRDGIPPAGLQDWTEGLAAWKALEDASPEDLEKASEWLAGKDHLNSGYKLERKRWVLLDADVVESELGGDDSKAQLLALLSNATTRKQIQLVETRSSLRLDPSDVGVGISQVLPVVVAAIAPGPSVVAVEQPELHIHPAMQVALGDLFIEGVARPGMSFLIETHSEHLMLRLLRRIRETTEGELTAGSVALSPDDVSVVYVQFGSKGVEMLPLPIDKTGEFSTRWPKGFFDERAEELF